MGYDSLYIQYIVKFYNFCQKRKTSKHWALSIEHVCQLAGDSLHVGIGTDLDGAFGKEQTPYDLDTIADLQKVPHMLKEKGYLDADIENIMSKNFIDFIRRTWK